MNNGYIKLFRSLLEWEWYSDSNVVRLFIHCLLKANHKDKNHQGILIERGTFMTSLEKLHIETGLSIRQVRTAISKLKLTNELTSISYNKYRIIKVNKYDEYQFNDKQTTSNLTSELTSKRQGSDKVATTTNNEKNDKNEKKVLNNYVALKDFWNSFENLPKLKKLTQKRKDKIKLRIDEIGLDEFKRAIKICDETPFLHGKNNRGWKANIDWLITNDTNIVKVLEGKYGDSKPKQGQYSYDDL